MSRAAAVALILAACAGPDEPGPTGDTFIAFTPAFRGFRGWTSFHSDGPADDGTVSPDALGARTLYIDPVPQSGAAAFPVGTIVIEARETGTQNIFARVKRGGTYNTGGARDWEWFELIEQPDLAIVWRGIGPPNGESYGGDPNACNACHADRCAGNDFTCSPTLSLASF
ncbi:MAG: hypothetical protein KF773_06835 [Deltaproteobacteria bacterium]|nr:hypothetical protein [Deltaproteobacteria bacterium]MCW5803870.1 hypothetical protein [Deltaproteobacteria bacterium]